MANEFMILINCSLPTLITNDVSIIARLSFLSLILSMLNLVLIKYYILFKPSGRGVGLDESLFGEGDQL